MVESVTALLVLVEIVVLFSGVTTRYVFHKPLVWSDELASILFLWLSMLGAVVALRRGEHMRMTALVDSLRAENARAGGHARRRGLSHVPGRWSMASRVWSTRTRNRFIVTPGAGDQQRVARRAIPVGMSLMILVALLRLLRISSVRHDRLGLAGAAVVVIGVLVRRHRCWRRSARPTWSSSSSVIVAANVFAGVPIAFSFALATFGYLALTTTTPMLVMVGRLDEGMSHLILLAVPLFIFLGALIEMTGMARAMIQFLASLLGHVRGGLSYVLIGAMYLVSGISGSKIADMAAIAPVLFPEMKKRGAKPGDLVALLATTGAQTETIPPSIVLITIGSVTGLSIAALFTGGLLPAVVLGPRSASWSGGAIATKT